MKQEITRALSTTAKIENDFPGWDKDSNIHLTSEQQKFFGVQNSVIDKKLFENIRNKFYVDNHSYQNICKIMEDISDRKLSLQIQGDRSFTDGKLINVPTMLTFSGYSITDEKLHYTLLEHELAHIIFESDMRNFDIFEKWFLEYSNKYVENYVKTHKVDTTFIDLFNTVDWTLILRAVLNIIEDHRIEHNWGNIYPGSRYRFNDIVKGLATEKSIEELEHFIKTDHIANTLLISRIFKTEILNKNTKSKVLNENKDVAFCIKRLENVENKSAITTLIESRELMKYWMPKLMKQLESLPKGETTIPSTSELGNQIKNYIGHKNEECPTNQNCKTKKLTKKQETAFTENSKSGEVYLKKAGEKTQQRIEEKIKEYIDPEYYEGTKTGSIKVIGRIIEQDIYNSWRNGSVRDVDEHDVQKLKRFFSTVRAKNKISLDEEGDSIDPEAYIQFKANPNMNEIFNNTDITQGLDVSIVIDLSGSMSYNRRLDMATKYAKTLHKALAQLDNVRLRTWAFSGNRRNHKLTPVVEIPYDRLDNIQPEPNNIFTHTWNGIAHVANKMRGSSGKKLMIVLTDGMPEAGTEEIDKIEATREAVEYSFLTGTKVYVIKVGHEDSTFMRKIFGPKTNWTVVENMEDAEKHLWSQVVKAVYRTLIQ